MEKSRVGYRKERGRRSGESRRCSGRRRGASSQSLDFGTPTPPLPPPHPPSALQIQRLRPQPPSTAATVSVMKGLCKPNQSGSALDSAPPPPDERVPGWALRARPGGAPAPLFCSPLLNFSPLNAGADWFCWSLLGASSGLEAGAKFWRREEKFCPVRRRRCAGKLSSIHSAEAGRWCTCRLWGFLIAIVSVNAAKPAKQTNKQPDKHREPAPFSRQHLWVVVLSSYMFLFRNNFEMLEWKRLLSRLLLPSTLPSQGGGGGGGGGIIQTFCPSQLTVVVYHH